MMRPTMLAALLACATGAWAQAPADELPAVPTSGPSAGSTGDELPAVETPGAAAPAAGSTTAKGAAPTKAAAAATGGKNSEGTTIIGDRESPIGLYITPWHNAAPEKSIDRPARLLSVGLDPLDRRVFARQVEYYEALTAAEKAKAAGGSPTAPAAKPAP